MTLGRRSFLRAGLAVGSIGAIAPIGVAATMRSVNGGRALSDTAEFPRVARPYGEAGGLRSEVLWQVGTEVPAIALTFDDGPDPRWTPQALKVLAEADAKATFFLVGERALRYPELVEAVVAAGHEIGTHTHRHCDLARATPERIAEELDSADRAINRLTGEHVRLMRPPWGHIDPEGLLAAARRNYTVVLWSDGFRGTHPDHDGRMLLNRVQPGSIVLATAARNRRSCSSTCCPGC